MCRAGDARRGPSSCYRRASRPRPRTAPEEPAVASDRYPVLPHIRERAHIASLEQYDALYRRSLEDPEGFWAEQAHIT